MNVLVDYNDFEDFCVCCDDCTASGPVVALGPIKREDDALREAAKAKAIELWNRRAVIDETEHWAEVVEQTIINGRAGFLEFARIMAKPGVSFTAEQNAAIKAAVEMGNTAEAQRMILDALEKALDIAPHS